MSRYWTSDFDMIFGKVLIFYTIFHISHRVAPQKFHFVDGGGVALKSLCDVQSASLPLEPYTNSTNIYIDTTEKSHQILFSFQY